MPQPIESLATPDWWWTIQARNLLDLQPPVYQADAVVIMDDHMVARIGCAEGRLDVVEVLTPDHATVRIEGRLATTSPEPEPCAVELTVRAYAEALDAYASLHGIPVDRPRMDRALRD